MKNSIITLESNKPGPTVAIFGGVHGNEKVGMATLQYLQDNLVVSSGKVYLVYANLRAIKEGVRYTEKNLNRCFIREEVYDSSYEQRRACELMDLLDTCDALLDLHAYNQKNGESVPFVLCEEDGKDIVSQFDIPIVVTNIDAYEKGSTDGYMFNQGKIGICVELGSIEHPEKFVSFGIKAAYQFLQYFGITESVYAYDVVKQKHLKITELYKKQTNTFAFSKRFKTFDVFQEGECICCDGDKTIYADKRKYILFPQESNPVGVEAYLCAIEQ